MLTDRVRQVCAVFIFLMGLFLITSHGYVSGLLFIVTAAIIYESNDSEKETFISSMSGVKRFALVSLLLLVAIVILPNSTNNNNSGTEASPSYVVTPTPTSSQVITSSTSPVPVTTSSITPPLNTDSSPQLGGSNTNSVLNNHEDRLRIGAFNVQVFGQSKASKPDVMNILAKTIRNYDIIGIEEIRDESQTALPSLVSKVNDDGSQYAYIVSDRLGRTSSKEQYAYIYNTKTVQLEGSPEVYPSPSGTDQFQRNPYIAEFKDGGFDAEYIDVHTEPTEATSEINALGDVVKYVESEHPSEKNIIVMGDLNADGSYFNDNSKNSLSVYHWLIGNSVDTTTGKTVDAYDRIIVTDGAYRYFTDDSGVFRFDTAYGLSPDQTAAVSDHYPVYADFYCNGSGSNAGNSGTASLVNSQITSTPIPITTQTPVPVETSTPSPTPQVIPTPRPTPVPVETSTPSPTPQVIPTPTPTPTSGSGSVSALYIGDSKTNVFHTSGCSWGKKISPEHIVKFNSREDAIAEGYKPCGHCKP